MPRGVGRSAIDKQPVNEPVFAGPLGLAGDEQAERRFHGGPDKAVYVYAAEDLAWWTVELGRSLPPGFIGENLTVEGVDLGALRAGDELSAGAALLRVTEPRDPCAKLAARVGVAGFVRRFGASGRTGVYCAVVRGGLVRSGDPFAPCGRAGGGPTMREIVAARLGPAPD